MKSSISNSNRPGPLIAPVVLQEEGLKNNVKKKFREEGCQKPFKTNCFKKVLGLRVSGQGKLEFKSDFSKCL